jgi:hypothetical protein
LILEPSTGICTFSGFGVKKKRSWCWHCLILVESGTTGFSYFYGIIRHTLFIPWWKYYYSISNKTVVMQNQAELLK